MADPVLPVFVYGYLKRGGPGHHLVADHLADVRSAVAHGRRVDTGADYPGIVFSAGGEDVAGELLYIRPAVFDEVMEALDAYEQTEAPDRYTRITTTVSCGGEPVEVYAYEFTGPTR